MGPLGRNCTVLWKSEMSEGENSLTVEFFLSEVIMMNLKLLIEKSLTSISRRIGEAPRQKLAELAANNVSRSTFAVTNTFSILTDEIKKEVSLFINDLSRTDMNKKGLKLLQTSTNEFVLEEYEKHKQYLIKIRIFDISGVDFSDFVQKEIDEALSDLEIKFLILERKLSEERNKLYWDIGKILLSAIIGGFVGGYLKYLL